MTAAVTGNLAVVRELIDAGADVNKTDVRSRWIRRDFASLLLQSQSGATVLMHACEQGRADVVTELLYANANVNATQVRGDVPHRAHVISSWDWCRSRPIRQFQQAKQR